MAVNKVVITQGKYNDIEVKLLVSFDANENPVDVINLDKTRIGTVCKGTVEKVLNDIDSCILKLSIGEKGFIENRKLNPEKYIVRHSEKKKVCQGDVFNVVISQDKKGSKPFSCRFVPDVSDEHLNRGFIDYYVSEYAASDYEIVSDLPEVIEKNLKVGLQAEGK